MSELTENKPVGGFLLSWKSLQYTVYIAIGISLEGCVDYLLGAKSQKIEGLNCL